MSAMTVDDRALGLHTIPTRGTPTPADCDRAALPHPHGGIERHGGGHISMGPSDGRARGRSHWRFPGRHGRPARDGTRPSHSPPRRRDAQRRRRVLHRRPDASVGGADLRRHPKARCWTSDGPRPVFGCHLPSAQLHPNRSETGLTTRLRVDATSSVGTSTTADSTA